MFEEKCNFCTRSQFSSSCHQVQCLTFQSCVVKSLTTSTKYLFAFVPRLQVWFCEPAVSALIKQGHSLDHSSDWTGSGQVQLCLAFCMARRTIAGIMEVPASQKKIICILAAFVQNMTLCSHPLFQCRKAKHQKQADTD